MKTSLVIQMYDEIQKLIYPNQLSSFEYTKIEELLNTYTQEEILSAYKEHRNKPIQYIEKVLKNKKKTPNWLHKEITNQVLDEETKKDFEDFKNFLEEFRNEKWNK